MATGASPGGAGAGARARPRRLGLAEARISRLVIGVGAVVVAGLLVTTVFAFMATRSGEIAHAKSEFSNLSLVLAEQTSSALQPADSFLRDAVRGLSRQMANPQVDDERDLHQQLKGQEASLAHVLSLFVVGPDGRPTHSSRSFPPPNINSSDRSYFKAHLGTEDRGLVISEPRRNRAEPTKWTFFLSRVLRAEDGGLERVVVGSVDLDYFETLYRDIDIPQGGRILLLRRDGTILAGYPKTDEAIGRTLADAPGFGQSRAKLIGGVLESGRAQTGIATLDGVERIVSAYPVGRYPLVVSISVPLGAAIGDWRDQAIVIGLVALVGIGVFVFMLYLLYRQSVLREQREGALRASEERFELAARGTADGIWDWNVVTGEDYLSNRWFELLGYQPGDLPFERATFENLLYPDDKDGVLEAGRRHLEGRAPYDIEYRLRHKSGEYRWFRGRGQAVWDDDGAPLRMAGSITDITERKRAEAALRQSEEKLNAFFNNAPVGMAMYDREIRYTKINRQLAWQSGLSVDEHVGKSLREIKPEFASALEEAYRRVFETDQAALNFEVEGELPGKLGVRRWWWGSAFPTTWDEDGPSTIGVVALDVTERKQAEAEIQELNERLERRVEERTGELRLAQQELVKKERLATLGQLAATVSHELRNPLGTIQTSVAVIDSKVRDKVAGVDRALDRVFRNVDRCDRIIEEMLDFTRAPQVSLVATKIDTWLAAVLDDLGAPEGVEMRRQFGAGDARAAIDGERLRRAVINVHDNACQAMTGAAAEKAATGERVMSVTTAASGGRLEISFSDTGSGMPADVLDNAFEPLFSTKAFGVGLGLPTVKQIMELHSGGVEIESVEGHGTRVVLWLPTDNVENQE